MTAPPLVQWPPTAAPVATSRRVGTQRGPVSLVNSGPGRRLSVEVWPLDAWTIMVALIHVLNVPPPTDIDECALGTDTCQQVCVNTPGSYLCECYIGYELNGDGTTCNGM